MSETVEKTKVQTKPDIEKTQQQWIESAPYLKAERFEVAGALYDVTGKIKASEVQKRIKLYRGEGGK